MSRRWLRIAHRGASASAPEHTQIAFQSAVNLGVEMIELDVQLSRDGALVVIHDLTLDRTTNGRGLVRQHDWGALRQLDTGSWFAPRFAGQRVLRLEDVIALAAGRVGLNVEMKGGAADWQELASGLIHTLQASRFLDATIVSCFEPFALERIRAESNDVRLGLLWQSPNLEEAWAWAHTLRATSLHPYWALVSADLIRKAHDRGLQVFAWTVNDVEVMRRLIREGVDGIMSDVPERFAALEGGGIAPATP